MAKEDIVGGLVLAIQKGESLEQAMASFLNAGYKNGDIQAAARILQSSSDATIPAQNPPLRKFSPINLFHRDPTKQMPMNKPLIPVAEKTKKLISAKKSLSPKMPPKSPQQVQPSGAAPQSVSLSQHLEGVEDPSKVPQVQQPSAPQPVPQQAPQSPISPQPFQGTSLESRYESPTKGHRSMMIMVLSIVLFLLVLSLLGVFLFKDSLIGIFNNLF